MITKIIYQISAFFTSFRKTLSSVLKMFSRFFSFFFVFGLIFGVESRRFSEEEAPIYLFIFGISLFIILLVVCCKWIFWCSKVSNRRISQNFRTVQIPSRIIQRNDRRPPINEPPPPYPFLQTSQSGPPLVPNYFYPYSMSPPPPPPPPYSNSDWATVGAQS